MSAQAIGQRRQTLSPVIVGQTFDDSKDGKPVGELKLETPEMHDGAIHFQIQPASAVVIEVK